MHSENKPVYRPQNHPHAAKTRFVPIQPPKPASADAAPSLGDQKTKVRLSARPAGGGKTPPQKPKGRKTAKAVWANIGKAALALFCVGVMAFSVFGVALSQYLVDSTRNDDLILNLETISVPQTGAILAKDETEQWVEYQQLKGDANSRWVPLSEIPQTMKDAVISTEDRDFKTHDGFSPRRTLQAALNEVFHFRDTFGASTIDQQLVKNITGEKEVADEETGSMEAGYKRKAREIYRAVGLNNRYSKDMILEAYLNTMPLSGTIVGVQAAAREYFYKDIGECTLAETAMIAGITQYPSKYNPYQNPEACKERRNVVLWNMLDTGTISQAEYEEAAAAPLALYDGPRQADTDADQTGVNSYFSDAVYEAVVTDLVAAGIAPTRQAASYLYYNGGLQIESTINMKLQTIMEDVYEHGYDEEGLFPLEVTAEAEVKNADGTAGVQTVRPQSAMAVVDYSGALVGVVGGIGEKKESLGLNRATQSPRSIGSTMKPLTAYALGIENDLIDYSRLVSDSYVTGADGSTSGTPSWPKNYTGEPSNRPVLVCDAVAESLNTVPVRIGSWLGLDPMFEQLRDTLGVTSLVDSGAENDMGLSSLVIGGMTHGITASELAAAYTIFGGENSYGVYHPLHCYTRVLDAQGNVLLSRDPSAIQAVSPETGYIVNRLMSNVLRSSGPVGGTANGMALTTSDSVAKTGTTTDDKDRWFVGLSPNFVAAVWWGYDQNIEMNWPPAASTNPPPNVWREVMDRMQADMPAKDFPARPDTVVEARFCRDSGLLAGADCPNTQIGYYKQSSMPETCPGHAG